MDSSKNTTANHQQTLEEYGGKSKTWKDPVGLVKWQALEQEIAKDQEEAEKINTELDRIKQLANI